MGKKKIIGQTEEQLIKETDKVDEAMKKASDKATSSPQTAHTVRRGRVYVSASYNNTIITFTDEKGNVLGWSSSGTVGFKGSKKSTPYAAGKVAEIVAQKMKKEGIGSVNFFVKGIGSGRDAAARAFINNGININLMKDVTPAPHNGCRPPKVRRV
jgi:small subunit ribosomal protein S11